MAVTVRRRRGITLSLQPKAYKGVLHPTWLFLLVGAAVADTATVTCSTKPADYDMPVDCPADIEDIKRMRYIMGRELPQDPLDAQELPYGMHPDGTLPHEEYDAVEVRVLSCSAVL